MVTTSGPPDYTYWGYAWGASILPYLEQMPLYSQIPVPDWTNLPYPANSVESTVLAVYLCPSDPLPTILTEDVALGFSFGGFAQLSYASNYGNSYYPCWGEPGPDSAGVQTRGIFAACSKVAFRDITDGTSNTFMIGEISGHTPDKLQTMGDGKNALGTVGGALIPRLQPPAAHRDARLTL